MIILSGGPYDGKKLTYANGDFIEMAPLQSAKLDFSVPTVEPFKVERIFYRRSMNNPNIFVFQP